MSPATTGPAASDGVVLLRPWRDEDAEWYAEAVRDPEIQRYTSEPAALTAEEVRTSFSGLNGQPHLAGFAVCDAGTGELLGNVGLRVEAGVGEAGYWVIPAGRGRGVATRALRLLSDWAWRSFELVELRLWTRADNAASGRVAERAGYRRAPELDQPRMVKGQQWQTIAFRQAASR